MNIQFKKGVLEMCVLLILDKSDYYGYELVSTLSDSISISEGTIYPLLKRLKDDGYVTTYIQESNLGPARKYYKITTLGKDSKNEMIQEWVKITDWVNKIKEGKK